MECGRIDESGYTGFDLMNPKQRFQGAAAIAISAEAATRLIKTQFPRLQADEPKYRALSKRPRNHDRLLGGRTALEALKAGQVDAVVGVAKNQTAPAPSAEIAAFAVLSGLACAGRAL